MYACHAISSSSKLPLVQEHGLLWWHESRFTNVFFVFFIFCLGVGGGPQICKIAQYFPSGFMNRKACCVRKQPSSFFSTALPLFELFSDELCWYILTVTALISKDTSNNEISMETHIHTSGDRVCCVNIPSTHIFK